VGGFDGNIKLNSNWSTTFQAVDSVASGANKPRTQDPAYLASFSRAGRSLGLGAGYSDIGSNFTDDLGYVPRIDIRNTGAWAAYRFYPESGSGWLQQWGPSFSFSDDHDHTGLLLDRSYQGNLAWNLKGQTSFGWGYSSGMEQLRPEDFSSLSLNQSYPETSNGFWSTVGYWTKVSLGGSYSWQKRINYYPAVGVPFSGSGNHGNIWLTIRPSSNLRIDNSYVVDMMHTLPDTNLLVSAGQPLNSADSIYQNHILESKWNMQLSQALSVRFTADYNALLTNPALTNVQTNKEFTADILLAYTVHPGTAVFVGYNSDLQNLNRDLLVDGSNNILRTQNDFVNDGREFFVKIAYLFRF
jgi:hypothetical protein